MQQLASEVHDAETPEQEGPGVMHVVVAASQTCVASQQASEAQLCPDEAQVGGWTGAVHFPDVAAPGGQMHSFGAQQSEAWMQLPSSGMHAICVPHLLVVASQLFEQQSAFAAQVAPSEEHVGGGGGGFAH